MCVCGGDCVEPEVPLTDWEERLLELEIARILEGKL